MSTADKSIPKDLEHGENRRNEHDDETRGNKIMTITITMLNIGSTMVKVTTVWIWPKMVSTMIITMFLTMKQFLPKRRTCSWWYCYSTICATYIRTAHVQTCIRKARPLRCIISCAPVTHALAHVLGWPASWRLVIWWQWRNTRWVFENIVGQDPAGGTRGCAVWKQRLTLRQMHCTCDRGRVSLVSTSCD